MSPHDITKPHVSVIVPAFNPGAYLGAAVRSVLAQSFEDWEMVVIDDGSTEDISQQVPSDPRIHIRRQQNLGLARARNAGIHCSRGTWLAFLDADDLWLPTKLQRQIDLLEERPDVALCDTRFEMINEHGEVVGPGYQGYHKSYLDLLTGCGICVSTVIVRKTCVDEVGLFDVDVAGCEDYDMWLKISRKFELARVESCQAQYRIHPQNMSRNYAMMYKNFKRVLRKHQVLARSANDVPATRAVSVGFERASDLFASQAIDQARQAFRKKKLLSALGHLEAAFKMNPRALVKSLAQKIAS
jgi:glycosyltransferase involved in cell wall biosynthesis